MKTTKLVFPFILFLCFPLFTFAESSPLIQNISGRNVIVGDISGTVTQKDNSKKTKSGKGKPNWLNILYWIIGILVGITILITFTKELIKI